MDAPGTNRNWRTPTKIGVLIGTVVITGLWFAFPFLVPWAVDCLYPAVIDATGAGQARNRLAEAGQFGDQFGALNAFVSMLTVLAVVVSVLLQRGQHLTEMQTARDHHDGQMRDAEEKHTQQMREAKLARDLDRLFRLFDRKSQVVSELRWRKHDGETLEGREALKRADNTMFLAINSDEVRETEFWKDINPFFIPETKTPLDEAIIGQDAHRERYEFIFSLAKFRVGEYFRTIVAIAKSAARAKREGDEAFVETALQWITIEEMRMLEWHSLIDLELARALRDLKWTAGEYERMCWSYPKREPSAPAGARVRGEI